MGAMRKEANKKAERVIQDPYLFAARCTSAACSAVLGQLAVDMPEGYLGPADQITLFGSIYAAAVSIVAILLVRAGLKGRVWAFRLSSFFFSINLGVFLPGLAFDPLVAGVIVVWHLVLLFQIFFPGELRPAELHTFAEPATAGSEELASWLKRYGPAVRHLLVLSVLVTVIMVGFQLGTGVFSQLISFIIHLGSILLGFRFLLLSYRTGQRKVLLFLVPLLLSLYLLPTPEASLSLLVLFQLGVLGMMMSRMPVVQELIEYFFRRPVVLAVFTFGGVILFGTLLLSFPAAAATGHSVSLLNAFFTSTSAVCVTGLTVLDTGSVFSFFGQAVILCLIQVGGLGIMVLSTFAALLLGGKLSLTGEQALIQLLESRSPRDAYRLTAFIVVSTLAIEGVGALILTGRFAWSYDMPFARALWSGVFHSISAFCNAGFSLHADNLISFQRDPLVLGTIAALVVLGGIGFLVMLALYRQVRSRRYRLSIQHKSALLATLYLIGGGALVMLLTEWNASFSHLGFLDKVMSALFQSITPRTAGFNSVDYAHLSPATAILMQVLMFIGASPGGTGGGIKTTTFLVLAGVVRSLSRGEGRVRMFQRRVSDDTVFRCVAIAMLTLSVALTAIFVLLLSQDIPFDKISFEVFSALGTVGLSIGATGMLDPIGKVVICMVMFIGRIGPLTLALLFERQKESRIGYPEARLMVG